MQRNVCVNQRPDVLALVCLALIALGWFAMNTLVVSFGPFTHITQFYEMGVVLAHPVTLFVGVGDSHELTLTCFTMLALATLFTVMTTSLVSVPRSVRLLGWLPLALMLVCFAILYFGGPSPQIDAAAPDSSVHDYLVRMAGHLTQHLQNAMTAHISLGAGGALSLLASAALGIRTTLRYLAFPKDSARTAVVASMLRA
jgi:hypothetical protein